MTKILFAPIIIMLALTLLATSVLAQQSGLEKTAEEKQFEASTLLGELNAREFENPNAQESLMQANNAFDEGMTFFESGSWQNAIESFDNAIYLGGEAVVFEEAEDIDIGEVTGLDMPWGEGIDLENVGTGVKSSDFTMLMGIIFISIFIILPVTYYLV